MSRAPAEQLPAPPRCSWSQGARRHQSERQAAFNSLRDAEYRSRLQRAAGAPRPAGDRRPEHRRQPAATGAPTAV